MHPSLEAEQIANDFGAGVTHDTRALVFALLAIADGLVSISQSLDNLERGRLTVEIDPPLAITFNDPLRVDHKEV